MNYEIKLSSFAASDLDEIWNYIAHVLKSPIAANNTVNGIIDSISVLKDFPESGTILYFESDLQSGYRYVVYNLGKDVPRLLGGGFHFRNQLGIQSPTDSSGSLRCPLPR